MRNSVFEHFQPYLRKNSLKTGKNRPYEFWNSRYRSFFNPQKAHKVLIGSAIPYFNNMFFSGMREKDQKEITLKIGPEYGLESTDAIKEQRKIILF